MKPLYVLLIAFVLALLGTRFIGGAMDLMLAGNVAMSAMLCFTAVGHFAFTPGMAMMMPSFIPCKHVLVLATGVLEIVAAIRLLLPGMRHITAVMLIIFFVLILPTNIRAALRRINYEKGTFDGPGVKYLWLRVPLQLLFIGWVVYFCW